MSHNLLAGAPIRFPPDWGKVPGHEDVFPGPVRDEITSAFDEDEIASALDEQVGGNHYRRMAIQPIVFCHRNRLGPCESAVVKYVCRHGDKGGVADLRKAQHYLAMLIEMQYSE